MSKHGGAPWQQSVLAAITDGVVIQDSSGAIVLCNAAAERILGLSSDQALGRTSFDPRWSAIREDGSPFAGEGHPAMVALRTGAPVHEVVMGLQFPEGGVRWLSINAEPILGVDGRPNSVVTTFNDVTEHRRAEAELRKSEARFRALTEESPVAVVESDAGGRIAYLNRAAEVLTGRCAAAVLGLGWTELMHPGDRERVGAEMTSALFEGRSLCSEYRVLRPEGTERLVRVDATALRDSQGAITGFIGISTDISAHRALQEQLAINARLAAMATLVGGLAHEINNPLAAVSAAGSWAADVVGTLRDQLALGPPRPPATQADQLDEVLETLHEVRLGADRIAALVKKLVRFGHPSRERRPLHLRDVVTQTLRWMPVAAAGRVEIEVRDLGAPKVLGSEDELAQVVVNLLTNAVQSIPEDRTGHVVVRLGPGGRGRSRLEVEDDGVGIPPEVAGRIFDPFFTTRDVGQGMGLGLAVAHAIVRAHEGTLEVSSTPGAGATLRMELPALNDAAPPPPLGGR